MTGVRSPRKRAMADQILAVLNEGAATAKEIAASVGLLPCEYCERHGPDCWCGEQSGRQGFRLARYGDVYPVLSAMRRSGEVQTVEYVAGRVAWMRAAVGAEVPRP